MAKECRRGNWIYVHGDGKQFIACKDYLGIGPAGYAAPFWATATDGHAQVFRNPLAYKEICRFVYFGGTFEIAYDLVGVADLNSLTPEEKAYLFEVYAKEGPESPCQIFGQSGSSWIEGISQEQFDRFIADITDPALYHCLLECVLPINPPSKPWGYGYEKPSRIIDALKIAPSVKPDFFFITEWLAGKRRMPRAEICERKLLLSEPVLKP